MPTPTTPLLDSFNRANEDPLAGRWLGPIFAGDGTLRLVGNVAQGRSTGGSESYHPFAFPANQEVFVTLAQKWSTLDQSLALFLNVTNPNSAGMSGYAVAVHTSSALSQDACDMYRIDAMAFTLLATFSLGVGAIASGNRFWLRNLAGVLTLYQNKGTGWTSIATATDTTYGAGVIGLGQDDATLLTDDFGGGAIGSASRMLAVF